MKITDYCPRAAPFDSYLKGRDLVGVEVGVDVGAHAEALLTYCPVAMLTLVDIWPSPWTRGYCEGRLARFRDRAGYAGLSSIAASVEFRPDSLDFVYIDQEHDGESVADDLAAWWPLLKPGGVLGYRNYQQDRGSPLDLAIERFVALNTVPQRAEDNEVILFKPR
jgi:predicted O-methyltransferase YrrM